MVHSLEQDRSAHRRPAGIRFDFIDLAVPLRAGPSDAGPVAVRRTDHRTGGDLLGMLTGVRKYGSRREVLVRRIVHGLGFGIRARDFPDGHGLAWEFVSASTHAGTHMDAPYHYGPTAAGAPAATIDEIPLDRCFGPGLRVDVREALERGRVRLDDVRRSLDRAESAAEPGTIVLFWTGADAHFGTAEYLRRCPGIDVPVLDYFLDRGVFVLGTDAFGFDDSFRSMGDAYRSTGDASTLWPSHLHGRLRPYCQIEKLANLGALPRADGFQVACFPVKVDRGSAGWVRPVALVPRLDEGETADG